MTSMDENITGTYEVHLNVIGMMCQKNCGTTVREALFTIPGCVSAVASFENSSATVVVNYSQYIHATINFSSLSDLQKKIEEDAIHVVEGVGFDASLRNCEGLSSLPSIQNKLESSKILLEDDENDGDFQSSLTFQVGGMSCAACTGRVDKALRKLAFVDDVKVNLATGRVQVQLSLDETETADTRLLCQTSIEDAGYECAMVDMSSTNATMMKDFQEKEISSWKRRLIIACALSSPLILHHLISMISMHNMHSMYRSKIGWDEWLGFALATPVQFIVGDRYYRAAYAALKNGCIGMDFLIVLG